MKVVILFDRFGPYHIARLEAAAKHLTIYAFELFGETSEYQWDRVRSPEQINHTTLFHDKEQSDIGPVELREILSKKLADIQPDVVAVNGWAHKAALICLDWCLSNRIPVILMSESALADEKRKFWKEWVKQKIIQKVSTGLVGGIRHVKYLVRLGMRKENIFLGYDVVDNNYFFHGAIAARQKREFWRLEKNLPDKYFLIVSRFIEKKNLPFVIDAYHKYVEIIGDGAWHLFVLGDGPLKGRLLERTNELGLQSMIHFEGFKQYNELPIYFGLANALIHASTTEQWGLVVNEAMASGLPVLVSECCGCVPELVHAGKNGFSFSPYNQDELTTILQSFSNGACNISEMRNESLNIIRGWNAEQFGVGLYRAATKAKAQVPKRHSLISKFFLRLLTR